MAEKRAEEVLLYILGNMLSELKILNTEIAAGNIPSPTLFEIPELPTAVSQKFQNLLEGEFEPTKEEIHATMTYIAKVGITKATENLIAQNKKLQNRRSLSSYYNVVMN